jgi:hypothetical protein
LFASDDGCSKICLWDIVSLASRQLSESDISIISDLAVSPHGKQLASASWDKNVRLWDVETGTCQLVLTDHEDRVTSVAYSLNGDLLASGSDDKTVRIWKVATGTCCAVLQNLGCEITGVCWRTTSDGDYLIVSFMDGSILMWKVIELDNSYRVDLQWNTSKGALHLTGAHIEGVRGLSQLNKQLLAQRGAVGEPEEQESPGTRNGVITVASNEPEPKRRRIDQS